MADRVVLVDVSADPRILDLYEWQECNDALKKLEDSLRVFHGLSGNSVRTYYQQVYPFSIDSHVVKANARVVAFMGDAPKVTATHSGPLLLGVEIGGKPGWRPAEGPFTAVIGCSREGFSEWLVSFLLDVFIANSDPIWPVVEATSRNMGFTNFFLEKVSFATHLAASKNTPVSADAGYVALSTFARAYEGEAWGVATPERFAEAALAIWDDFLGSRFSEFFQTADSAAESLLKRAKIGGQLSPQDVRNGVSAGIGLAAIFTPRMRQARDLASEAASVFSFKSPTRNSMAFLSDGSLWRDSGDGVMNRRKTLLAEGRVRLERYYAKN